MNFFESVYEAVKLIPEGKVASYGQIALAVGSPRASRQVGWALHNNPYQGIVPCHRVVFRDGKLTSGFAFGGMEVQKSLLESEGVVFKDEFTVDIDKCGFIF
ncbi:MAG: MGMT family protein [Clostridia bacterium]|nr:MGMT family protein [Clostridia bacterium]